MTASRLTAKYEIVRLIKEGRIDESEVRLWAKVDKRGTFLGDFYKVEYNSKGSVVAEGRPFPVVLIRDLEESTRRGI